ncbi:MAG: helix-turn-helix transcriptional regulator [Pseudomonadota bacterium]
MKIGNVLKLLRTSIGSTQNQMADMFGISQNYLSLIEQNKKIPSNDSIKAFASSLRVSEDALKLIGSEAPAELDDKDSKDYLRLQQNILSLLIFQLSGELKNCA